MHASKASAAAQGCDRMMGQGMEIRVHGDHGTDDEDVLTKEIGLQKKDDCEE